MAGQPDMAEEVLVLKGVTRDFFDGKQMRTVLQPTDLGVRTGELTVIAGPSGSGKTTLLTIMGLVLAPTTGRVVVRGEDVTDYSGDRRAVLRLRSFGFVFQQAALLPALSVTENLLVARTIQGGRVSRELKEQAGELLRRLGLTDFAAARPQQLSTGQQQRVGIARAMLGDPFLLLCDEPTSALDVESSGIVLDTLKQVSQDDRRGVVLISHDPRVFPYADRLIKLEDGKIVDDSHTHKEGGDENASDS